MQSQKTEMHDTETHSGPSLAYWGQKMGTLATLATHFPKGGQQLSLQEWRAKR